MTIIVDGKIRFIGLLLIKKTLNNIEDKFIQ